MDLAVYIVGINCSLIFVNISKTRNSQLLDIAVLSLFMVCIFIFSSHGNGLIMSTVSTTYIQCALLIYGYIGSEPSN